MHLPTNTCLHGSCWPVLLYLIGWALLCAGLEVQTSQECDCLCKTWNCYCGQP